MQNSRKWTSTEDSILQRGVNKYGLTNWHKVSTLLSHRSAAECKSRWRYVISAPKTDFWTLERDQELKKLAKVMPSMWQSISASIGASAQQCIDRYYQIQSNVETKPGNETNASSDEEQSKNLLDEANIRLQNTLGRKSKRKLKERRMRDEEFLKRVQKHRKIAYNENVKVETNYNTNQKNSGMEVTGGLKLKLPEPEVPSLHVTQLDRQRVKVKLSGLPPPHTS